MKKYEFKQVFDSNSAYHSNKDFLSSTTIKTALKSALHYKHFKDNGIKETDALIFGKLCHAVFLDVNSLENDFIIFDTKDRPNPNMTMASKDNKAWLASINAKAKELKRDIVKKEDLNICIEMLETVTSNKYLESVIYNKNNEFEKSFYLKNFEVLNLANGKESFVNLKVRPDIINYDNCTIYDLKTTSCADSFNFNNDIEKYNYDLSAYLYCLVLEIITGKTWGFSWLAVEKESPYHYNLINCSHENFRRGKEKLKACLETIVTCDFLKQYPSYNGFNSLLGYEATAKTYEIKELNIKSLNILKG